MTSRLLRLPVCLAVLCAGLSAQAQRLSEIRIDQTDADNDEYFEIHGPPGASLDGVTLLVIGDGAGGSGTIEEVTTFVAETIPDDGYFVVAEGTFTLGEADFTGDVNFENSDNVTFLLVRGFTGADGSDLDADDNGELDTPLPWTEELDRIALVETENPPGAAGNEYHYGPPRVGPDTTFVPGHVYRCHGLDNWQIGPFDPIDGLDTPGVANDCPARILIYGPGGTGSTDFFAEGVDFEVADAETWASLTTADFEAYDAVWADGDNCDTAESPFQLLVDTQGAWGPAVRRVAINIADPDFHANNPSEGLQPDLFIENHSVWLTELGPSELGGATGMYLSTGCTHAEKVSLPPLLDAYRPTFGEELTGVVDEAEPTAITAEGAVHPVLAGITLDPGLQWGSYCHGAISDFPAAFTSLVTCPNGSGLIVRDVGCGDTILDEGEECDAGGENGTSGSCCSAECTYVESGTACGDETDDECTAPDTCDAVGVCQSNDEEDDTPCGDIGVDCYVDDVCEGGVCVDQGFATEDTACGDSTDDECANPDSCDGKGLCLANDEEPGASCGVEEECAAGECDGEGACDRVPFDAGTPCGDETATECDLADECDGAGTCDDNLAETGASCGDESDTECTNPDTCNGLGACLANHDVGASCGDSTDTDCNNPDLCTAEGTCAPNLEPNGTLCASDAAFCTGIEACSAGACVSAGDPCNPDTETCAEDLDACILQCGDGMLDEDEEDCDDGNTDDEDGCSSDCEIEHAWDCSGEPGEESVCTATCGDSEVAAGAEECDDGDGDDGDGCSQDCAVEPGFLCDDSEPSVCGPEGDCGNGVADDGEVCDDGNEENGDGCSNTCDEEPGFFCDDSEPSVCAPDADRDNIPDDDDNCPTVANPDQADTDDDGDGNACDDDQDNDQVEDGEDNCPDVVNPGQEDQDEDEIGDACDEDRDGDGLLNDAEPGLGTDPDDPDSDDDGLNDGDEIERSTFPTDPDTDDGGVLDGEEVATGTDPLDGSDDYNLTGGKASDACATAGSGATPVGLVLAGLVLVAVLRRRELRQ